MQDEPKHVESIPGHSPPSDIFQPYVMGVELFSDMDALFRRARRMAAGEPFNEAGEHPPNMVEGQRAVAIVTPGRLIMLDPCPKPNSVPEEKIAEMCELLPPDPPLTISVISYTRIEALTTDMDKAIPFRGFLIAWAYAGHSVVVFEGHPSAFDSSVRDCDVLLMDSGMMPFVQFNWIDAARRVMHDEGRIFVHNRENYTLSLITRPDSAHEPRHEAEYVELLLRLVARFRPSVEITSGEVLPDLPSFISDASEAEGFSKMLTFDSNQLDADLVIKILLQLGGWRWYNPFKTTGVLRLPMLADDGRKVKWNFRLTLGKNEAGKRQLLVER